MPYIKKTIVAGKTIETRKVNAPMYGRKKARAARQNLTTEKQRILNERHAVDTLTWTLNENFGIGDIHLILTYGKGAEPAQEEAKRNLERFLREARKYFRRQGKELRYVATTEYKNKRIHHHLVTENIPAKDLYALWTHGRPKVNPLDDTGNYRELAEYLIKETSKTFAEAAGPYKKRWNQSKNLRKPKIKIEVVPAKQWKREPKPLKGYYIEKDSVKQGIHDITGYPYQYYTMIKIDRRC